MTNFDPNNGIQVDDIVLAFYGDFWKVTSIEPRFVNEFDIATEPHKYLKIGDVKSSMIHFELFCDENYNLSDPGKRKNKCEANLCKKINFIFIKELINEKLKEVEKLLKVASASKLATFTLPLVSLSPTQVCLVQNKVDEWLSITGERGYPDASHSVLLARLLSGKKALSKAPPSKNSYPWYALGEGEKIELDPEFDKIREFAGQGINESKILVNIGNSSPFEWYDKEKGILVYPKTKELFRIWDEEGKKYIQKVAE